MAAESNPTTPYWTTIGTGGGTTSGTSSGTSAGTFPTFARLDADLDTEVLVVGAGLTGLTTAYLLAKAGKRVIVLERERCAMADTGHTSAHLTMVTDTRLSELVERFGRDHAQAVWDAGLAAIARIEEIVRELEIDCAFERLDGYLHAPPNGDVKAEPERLERLQEDCRLALELGFDADYLAAVPLFHLPGIRFPNQARLHPRRYLAGVAKAFVALGGRIFEHSAAGDFCEEPRSVEVNGRTVSFEDVVLATHNPLAGLANVAAATLFQTKLALYTSYVIAGRVPHGSVPDGLWSDTGTPYDYLRIDPHRDFDVVIFGGEDYKTGQKSDTEEGYRRLEARLTALCPQVELTHRWSGQVIASPDGLPYIGGIGNNGEQQYIATAFAGNGWTFGTLAAMMISEAISGVRGVSRDAAPKNPWADLFDPSRKALQHGLWDYLKENADYPYYLIRSRFAGPDAKSLRAVKKGEGAIVERAGKKVAAYRDTAGNVTLCSAICTHMGCVVAWNGVERTWDCPCHGSRFHPTGGVMAGPAEAPLAPAE